MRTTIELSDEHRAKLLALAAHRGHKGFSRLVREALDHYPSHQLARQDQIRKTLELRGAWSDEDADALEATVIDLRTRWSACPDFNWAGSRHNE